MENALTNAVIKAIVKMFEMGGYRGGGKKVPRDTCPEGVPTGEPPRALTTFLSALFLDE